MGSNITFSQVTIAGLLAVGGMIWHKLGWLLILWVACAALDFLTGCLAALHSGKWDSQVARNGIWHKAGMIVIVLVAILFDLTLRQIIAVAGIQIPFEGVLVTPLVLSWYVVTELGSILENAIKMGAQDVPGWLKKGLAIASAAVDKAGETTMGGDDNGKDGHEKDNE